MVYVTGFCAVGLCEGTKPKSHSGKPLKVCTAVDICKCECHGTLTVMFEQVGLPRVLGANPEYTSAPSPDLEWLNEPRSPIRSLQPTLVTIPEDGQSSASVDSSGHYDPSVAATISHDTEHGGDKLGPLEAQVKTLCDKYIMGELDWVNLLTPKELCKLLHPDYPNIGAVYAVLKRWDDLGFADIKYKPTRFIGYTVAGMKLGLDRMKDEHRLSKRKK